MPETPADRIRAIVVDDSAVARRLISGILSRDPEIEVVATAADAFSAREKIKQFDPDVITLDLELPRMDGLTFLTKLMRLRPMPVVLVSAFARDDSDLTRQALAAGAVDYVTKPSMARLAGSSDSDSRSPIDELAPVLISKVKQAARGRKRQVVNRRQPLTRDGDKAPVASRNRQGPAGIAPIADGGRGSVTQIIALGASTGGTVALLDVLERFPADSPPVLIVQHIPPRFSTSFAKRLDERTALTVHEAENDMMLENGHAYVAPGDRHLMLAPAPGGYRCLISDEQAVNMHRPSVDVLFRSVRAVARVPVTAALLTGMGTDGAQGLLELRRVGACTIAQDEESSVVWGMPGEAVKLDAAQMVLTLEQIGPQIVEQFRRRVC